MFRPALTLGIAALLLGPGAHLARAQDPAPRTRVFTTSHDLISDADLTHGAVVVEPGTDSARTPFRRLNTENSSLRLPLQSNERTSPNLVRPNVTVDSTYDGYTSAPITDGKLLGAFDAPGHIWLSNEIGYQHWVDLEFADGPRTVSGVSIEWGPFRAARYKIQVADARGWLVDVTAWLDGSGSSSAFVPLAAVSTRRVRVVQDSLGGTGSPADGGTRVALMSVDELSVIAAPLPVAYPIAVDSSYLGYAASLIADGDTRAGTTADFWTETWVSAENAAQHWVEVRFFAPTQVAQVEIWWGHWSSARFKVQYWDGASFVDTSSSAAGWLDAGPWPAVSRIGFAPEVTTRLRVLQDANGGSPPGDGRVGLMSVAELVVHPAEAFARSAAQAVGDSSFSGFTPAAAFDGVRSNACAPSACFQPGELWLSAETPTDHWLELRLGHRIEVRAVTLDWGAWGSNDFQLQYWNGASWVVAASGAMTSNQSATFIVGATTDRLRVFQPAGAGGSRPDDFSTRPDLMSIGEILLGYPADGTYVSAPTRLSGPLAQVTLTAVQSNATFPQGVVAYSVSTDDGATWAPVSSGVPTATPPGNLVRWRAELHSFGLVSPEIEQVTLQLLGQPVEIGAALWRGGHSGAITVGVDDSWSNLGEPGEALSGGVFGSYFQWGRANLVPNDQMMRGAPGASSVSTYTYATFAALGHELGNHSETHECRNSPPDGANPYALDGEFTRKQNQLDALYPTTPGRVQSLAWPCGNYDLAKGSVARRFFVSSRGFRDGDPNGEFSCVGPSAGHCAMEGGEPQELLEEPTPRNFQNLRAIAADDWRSPSFEDAKNAVHWAEAEGNWAVLAYHYFTGAKPYMGEVERAKLLDLWIAPQGEVARYIRLRDSFSVGAALATPTTRDFTIQTTLTPADVPALNHAQAEYPASEVVERVFDGGITARVWSPESRGDPFRVRIWNNGVAFTPRDIEGNHYLLFDAPLTRALEPVRVEWVDTPLADDDLDGIANGEDNCRFEPNFAKTDTGGVGITTANLVGDVCECGDISNDAKVDTADVALLRARLSNPSGTVVSPAGLAKCATNDAGPASCDVADLVVLQRRLATPAPYLPGIRDACSAARPH